VLNDRVHGRWSFGEVVSPWWGSRVGASDPAGPTRVTGTRGRPRPRTLLGRPCSAA
jgi:hypothetical protein